MTDNDIRNVLDALAVWTWKEDDAGLHGLAGVALIHATPTHVHAQATVPNEVGEVILINLLLALRSDWPIAGQWLTHLLVAAQRSVRSEYQAFNYARGVSFRYDTASKQAMLRITRRV